MALLTYTEAAQVASTRLRRPITDTHVGLWVASNRIGRYTVEGAVYVTSRGLSQYLARIEPEWRLLTIPEAVQRVHELTKLRPRTETIRNWCTRGLEKDGTRVILPTAGWDGKRRLICPMELREYVWTVVPGPSDHPVGRPLGKRAHA